MENDKILVTDTDGVQKEAEILAIFNSEEFGKDYIVYTFNETQNDLIKILASTIIEKDDKISFEDIESDEEWLMVKSMMKDLAKSGVQE